MPSKRPPRRTVRPRMAVPVSVPPPHPGVEILPWVDLLRFAAIFLVMGHHLVGSGIPVDGSTGPRWVWFQGVFLNGAYGVAVFFTVSGFLITRMLVGYAGRPPLGYGPFYVRRVARILPLLFAVVLAGLLLRGLAGPAWGGTSFCVAPDRTPLDWKFWLAITTFQFNWLVIERISMGVEWGVLWSLAVEEQFYAAYPPLIRWWGRGRGLALFLGAVVVSGFLFRWWMTARPRDPNLWTYFASPACFDQIALGALAFLASEKWKPGLQRHAGRFLVLFGGAGLWILGKILSTANFDDLSQRWWGAGMVGFGAALFLLGGVHHPGLRGRVWRVLSWPGRFSYGCYLWHIPVLFLAWPILAGRGAGTVVALFLGLVWVFSAVSYYGYELPANRWVRALWGTAARP